MTTNVPSTAADLGGHLKKERDKLGLSRAELSQAEAKIGSFCFKLSHNTTNFKLELLRL